MSANHWYVCIFFLKIVFIFKKIRKIVHVFYEDFIFLDSKSSKNKISSKENSYSFTSLILSEIKHFPLPYFDNYATMARRTAAGSRQNTLSSVRTAGSKRTRPRSLGDPSRDRHSHQSCKNLLGQLQLSPSVVSFTHFHSHLETVDCTSASVLLLFSTPPSRAFHGPG